MMPEKERRWRKKNPVRWRRVGFFRVLAEVGVTRGRMRMNEVKGVDPISIIK